MAKKKPKGKFKVKIKRPGAFTAYCKRLGYGGVTQACIRKGLASKDPGVRKMANFARNASKWKKPKKGAK